MKCDLTSPYGGFSCRKLKKKSYIEKGGTGKMDESKTLESSAFAWGDVEKNWKWLLALGIFFVLTGTIGLILTPLATLSTILLFATFMMIDGVLQLFHGIKSSKGWKSRLLQIACGILYLMAGFVSVFNPVAASLVLTLVLMGAIMVTGIFKIIIAFQHRSEMKNWVLLLISGIASLIIAIIIGVSWPYSAIWSLGLLISVELIMSGWSQILIALAARKRREENSKIGNQATTQEA